MRFNNKIIFSSGQALFTVSFPCWNPARIGFGCDLKLPFSAAALLEDLHYFERRVFPAFSVPAWAVDLMLTKFNLTKLNVLEVHCMRIWALFFFSFLHFVKQPKPFCFKLLAVHYILRCIFGDIHWYYNWIKQHWNIFF